MPPAITELQGVGLQMGAQTSEAAPPGQNTESKHRDKAPGQKPCPLSLAPKACPCPPMSLEPPANSLPNLINDSLLLLNLITKSGQLLLVRFPVTLHLLLQSLLQARPGETWHQLVGTRPILPTL